MILLCCLLAVPSVHAVSTSSQYILLYPNQQDAVVGKETVTMKAPPAIIDGSMYVPAVFLGEVMGFDVRWEPSNRTIVMTPPSHRIVLSPDVNMIYADQAMFPFDGAAAIVDGSLMVKLTWIVNYLSASVSYNKDLNRVELLYIQNPNKLMIDKTGNSRPVAKFTTGKPAYKVGEPVQYIDLSYDPDSEGLPEYIWSGKEEAFFKAGQYTVSLQVVDGHGNKSETYRQTITVTDETYLTAFEYPLYMKPVGTFIKSGWKEYYEHYDEIPEFPRSVDNRTDRKLLVSDSPEEFTQKGVLYRDIVNGKARLYADHVNGTKNKMYFSIVAKNSTGKEVRIKTTNKGEVWPSIYANLIGNEATVDFLLKRPYEDVVVVPAGQTVTYVKMPELNSGQGINVIYDIETDGELELSFVASDSGGMYAYRDLPVLFTNDHIRGTFPVSEINWRLNPSDLKAPAKLPLGNGQSDRFIKGTDATRKTEVVNFGNWGVVYHIHMDRPPKMTLMVMAKGGYFKGPFKVNGQMVLVPQSGVLTAFDGVQIIGRTNGTEESLDIEYSPPAGSALPIDLIMFPLKDLR